MKVLITTSGLGNRLGNITKYTNKSLVRLGKIAAISHIINSYPSDTEFIITTGYYGSHVKQYVKLAHSDIHCKFVDVDKYEGIGSSLLYSMYCAKDYLNEEFIFHACDSLFKSPIIFNGDNVCVYSYKEDNSQYRTIVINDGLVKSIEEKGSYYSKNIHVGVIKIKNHSAFWEITKELLENFPTDTTLCDCHVINRMIDLGYIFETKLINEWYDIGNIDSLKITKSQFENNFKILDKETENIFIFPTYVIKFFYDSKIANDRVKRTKYLKNYGPNIIDSLENFYKYEYINGELASHNINTSTFYNALNDLYENFWTIISEDDSFIKKTKSFYIDKTKDRIKMFYKQTNSSYDNIVINGLKIDSIDILLEKIPNTYISDTKKYYFHGDFILDNLIIQDNKFKFLDWRQDFCGDLDGGDLYYDLAKLNHSLYFDHDLITNNNFTIEENKNNIKIDLLCKFSSIDKRTKYIKFLTEKNFDINKISILTSIIWLNMSPLHIYPLNKFLYYFGIYTLQTKINDM